MKVAIYNKVKKKIVVVETKAGSYYFTDKGLCSEEQMNKLNCGEGADNIIEV